MKHATDKTVRSLVTRQRRIEKALAGNQDATIRLIASDVLGIETLDTRNSDGLDFHDLAVCQVRKALEAAYEAGRRASANARANTCDAVINGRRRKVTIPND